jgi:hypothetical protein
MGRSGEREYCSVNIPQEALNAALKIGDEQE